MNKKNNNLKKDEKKIEKEKTSGKKTALAESINKEEYSNELNVAGDNMSLDKKIKSILGKYSPEKVFRISGMLRRVEADQLEVLRGGEIASKSIRAALLAETVIIKMSTNESNEIISVEEIKGDKLEKGSSISILAANKNKDDVVYTALVVKLIVLEK